MAYKPRHYLVDYGDFNGNQYYLKTTSNKVAETQTQAYDFQHTNYNSWEQL